MLLLNETTIFTFPILLSLSLLKAINHKTREKATNKWIKENRWGGAEKPLAWPKSVFQWPNIRILILRSESDWKHFSSPTLNI